MIKTKKVGFGGHVLELSFRLLWRRDWWCTSRLHLVQAFHPAKNHNRRETCNPMQETRVDSDVCSNLVHRLENRKTNQIPFLLV